MILTRLTRSRGYARSVGRKLIFGTLRKDYGAVVTVIGKDVLLNNRRLKVSDDTNEVNGMNEEAITKDKITTIFNELDGEVAKLGAYFASNNVSAYSAAIIMARLTALILAAGAELPEDFSEEVSEDA